MRVALAAALMAIGYAATAAPLPVAGTVVKEKPALGSLIAAGAKVEKVADGVTWAEGPVWIRDGGYLLLSDPPENRVFRWSAKDGLSVFMKPSGYAGTDTAIFREDGSNGLIPGDKPGTILMADSGSRGIARLDLATKNKTFLVTQYKAKKFNSPNDLVLARDGSIWFTDPPYGLKDLDKSPAKEMPFNGVYRLLPNGEVRLIDGSLTFPNGIGLSPDQRTLYVSVSDPDQAKIYAYSLDPTGKVLSRRVFADMTALVKQGLPGLPDGMKIDAQGNLFASGPGGIHILSPKGVELGLLKTDVTSENCAFGEDGRTLFIASTHAVLRVRTKTRGLGY
ncbi:MAG TPA: SMP-30/gluconolactonase/LRE family protein [Sphingomicrobium sp.]|nr:SMP-30/gluconolactonase/LRE family protein [Sphingomicrobium sp.]